MIRRYVEAAVGGIYLPNGNLQPGPKFNYKLAWFKRLQTHARKLLREDVPVVLAGDYNVASTEIDIYPTTSWDDDALVQPKAAPHMPGSSARVGPTRSTKCTATSGSTPSGTICAIAGSAMRPAPRSPAA